MHIWQRGKEIDHDVWYRITNNDAEGNHATKSTI
jgi:hypothetical protein